MRAARVALTILLVAALGSLGCGVRGSGVEKTEKREVGAFRVVDMSGLARVVVTVGEPASCTITGDDNIVPLLHTEVADGVLDLDSTRPYRPNVPLVVRLTTPALERIELSGAGALEVNGAKGDRLAVSVSGAGDARLQDIAVKTLTIKLSGAGDVTAKGTAGTLELDLSGAGEAELAGLSCGTAEVEVSGAGGVTVAAEKTLKARVSGAGTVKYVGSPSVESEVSGAGSVKPLAPPND